MFPEVLQGFHAQGIPVHTNVKIKLEQSLSNFQSHHFLGTEYGGEVCLVARLVGFGVRFVIKLSLG